MKPSLLLLLGLAFVLHTHAEETDYIRSIRAAREHLFVLDTERLDSRKPKPGLSPIQEDERIRLLGQLHRDDPIWALQEQLLADIQALESARPQTTADVALIKNLKDLLAITSGLQEHATTRAQAELFATALRRFIARRDVEGAFTWAQSQ